VEAVDRREHFGVLLTAITKHHDAILLDVPPLLAHDYLANLSHVLKLDARAWPGLTVCTKTSVEKLALGNLTGPFRWAGSVASPV
jgi:hypothetical protein